MPYEAVSFPIGGRDVYRGLIVLYCLIALYSALAVYFGAQTVEQATSPAYATIFPIALFACALAALYGVVRSRYTRRVWLEYAGTVLLLAGLMGYTCAIVWAATSQHEPWRVPGAVLPVMVSVFPTLRLLNILKVVKVRTKERAARAQRIAGDPRERS
jgi:hypothetical protein